MLVQLLRQQDIVEVERIWVRDSYNGDYLIMASTPVKMGINGLYNEDIELFRRDDYDLVRQMFSQISDNLFLKEGLIVMDEILFNALEELNIGGEE